MFGIKKCSKSVKVGSNSEVISLISSLPINFQQNNQQAMQICSSSEAAHKSPPLSLAHAPSYLHISVITA